VRSWWLGQVAPGAAATALHSDRRADICIVGGGFSGLWTALRVKQLQPGAEVVLVEADICGGGASGRNGGFAMSLWHSFVALERAYGSAEALRLARASCAAVDEIGSFSEEHEIDAQYRRDGWLWTATNRMQVGAWNSTVAAVERHGVQPFENIETEELAARSGSSEHLAGVFEPTAATVQPALLGRGLLRVARERGVAVFERSPMVMLERGRLAVVTTPGGRITADRVVIAMNAWRQGCASFAERSWSSRVTS
jgi:glycine/D-amino acid oxidase-like deaminating enzyme